MQGTDDFTLAQIPQGGRVVVISDFLDDPAPIKALVASATQSHATGALMQVLDPVEEQFPFGGRTVFTSMTGAMRFETLQAKSLRHDYLARLAARKDQLRQITDRAGWAYGGHHTDDAPLPALLWMHQALGARA